MIQNSEASLPALHEIIGRWWKLITGTVLVFTAIAILFLLIKPKEYLGVSTALPASGFASDRASIFNDNVQSLYTSIGLPDDLDRVIGTARLDTLYGLLTDEFNLVAQYGLEHKKNPRYRAIERLKDDTRVLKTDYGELKVKVWNSDARLAARLSQALLNHLQQLHQSLQLTNNKLVLQNLERSYLQLIQKIDSLETGMSSKQSAITTIRTEALLKQAAQYEQLVGEYQLLINTNPQVLVTVENAPVPVKHDRPDYLLVIILTLITSLVFAFLTALVLEKRSITLS